MTVTVGSELDPRNAAAYNNRGAAYLRKGDPEKAIANSTEAIRLNPKLAVAYRNRGLAYAQKQQYEQAITDCTRSVELDPRNAAVHNNLAWLLATCPEGKFRDGKKAVECAAKACELSAWKDPTMLDTLAAAHAECGQFDSAIKWQIKALDSARPDQQAEFRSRLELYRARKAYHQGRQGLAASRPALQGKP